MPNGWADVAKQAAVWFGFAIAYQLVRGLLRGSDTTAMRHGWEVVHVEQRLGLLIEPTIQKAVLPVGALVQSFNWVYWLSEFVVLGGCLTWIYLRRTGYFARVRNTILLANLFGLIGYLVVPTAPPRFFPSLGFVDTLDQTTLNQGSAIVQLASNPFAAMPSVHAADALIIGVAMALLTRSIWARMFWAFWPLLVWTSVVATANHFWLDVAAGITVAMIAGVVVLTAERLMDNRLGRVAAATTQQPAPLAPEPYLGGSTSGGSGSAWSGAVGSNSERVRCCSRSPLGRTDAPCR